MPTFIDYIIKLNICLAVVYLFYQLLLRRLTFYNWNRWYLMGYTVFSFIIPLINVMPSLQTTQLESAGLIQWIPVVNFSAPRQTGFFENLSLWHWVKTGLAIGSLILLCRFLVRLLAFAKMKKGAQLLSDAGTKIYKLHGEAAPFSFGNAIFINTDMHEAGELEDIIRHEFVHVKQKHSIDIIWCELLCVINWFNPLVWLIRHNVRQNLEFLADDSVLQNGLDKKEYQYLLLKVIGNRQFAFTSHFNFSSLKKRIVMMNTVKSAGLHLTRFLFLLPVIAVLLLSFRNEMNRNTQQPAAEFIKLKDMVKDDNSVQLFKAGVDTIPKKKEPLVAVTKINDDTVMAKSPLYFINDVEITDDNRYANTVNPDDIKSIDVIKGADAVRQYGDKGKNGVVMITTKSADGKLLTVPEAGEPDDTVNGTAVISSAGNGQVQVKVDSMVIIADTATIRTKGRVTGIRIDNLMSASAKEKPAASDKTAIGIKGLPENICYILNGERVSSKKIKKLSPDRIESMTVLKGESAIKYYGKKAKNGAIVIVSR